MSLDELGYAVGIALMIVGIFFSGLVVLMGIVILVLSMWLPEFVIIEFGTPEEEE
jgi:hypothetical protein